MLTREAILTRRTVHLWKPEKLPETVVMEALQAAHMAPCHLLTWPWNFIRLGAESRKSIFDLIVDLKRDENGNVSDYKRDLLIRKTLNPGELVVVTLKRCDNDFRARENYAAASCAIQNLALSIHANGYGSKWSTGKVTRDPRSYEILDVDAETHEIIGFIWMGVPEKVPSPPNRSDLSEHLRFIP